MAGGVLIVSAATGTGHLRAAEALEGAFRSHAPEVHVEHVELLSLAPRWVRALYGSAFEMIAARAPRLWKGIYRMTDGDAEDRARWAPLARRLLFREFRRLLISRRWDACLSTHFLPCQLAAGKPGLPPFALTITDFTLHRVWVQPGVDRYFVATETLAGDLRRRVRRAQVEATGIPISAAYAAAPAREAARAELGIDPDRRVALVVGGGLGIGVEEAAQAALAACDPGAQIVAVCGSNEVAKGRLEALRVPAERLRVLGFERGLVRWIAAADVVATKAGGLTVSETLALGRPLLLTRPIPGAEEGNTRAVAAEGAALAAADSQQMKAAFARVFTEPGLLPRLSEAAHRIGRPASSQTIAAAVIRHYVRHAAA